MPGLAEEELAAMSLKANGHSNGMHANGDSGMGATAYGDHSKVVGDLMDRLCLGGVDATSAAHEIALMVLGSGVTSMDTFGFAGQLQAAAEDTNSPGAREGAMQAYKALAENVGKPAEPYLIPVTGLMLSCHGDKNPAVRSAAEAAVNAMADMLNPPSASLVIQAALESMFKDKAWQCKEGALKLLRKLATLAKAQVQEALPDIVPVGSECMVDAREQVKKAAYAAMNECFKLQGNRDIEPCVPLMLSCIARPAEANNAITKLSATTFVQQVDNPALSIMVPLLIRGLRSNETPIKRKTAIIISNMSKLVNNPADATVFLPRLLPGLKILSEEVADPECRQVAAMAHGTLQRIEAEAEEVQSHASKFKLDLQAALPLIAETVAHATQGNAQLGPHTLAIQQHVARLAGRLVDARQFNGQLWQEALVPYLECLVGLEEAEVVAKTLCDRCKVMGHSGQEDVDLQEDVQSELLCNCEFSLAYGGKILLNGTKLVLRRGRRYGLCGANGVGKSTLMRAIAANKVDGFPPPDKLRTVYVEHDIQGSLETLSVVDYVLSDPLLSSQPREEVENALRSVGFTEQMMRGSITSLSGGWKMKLALARAMLLHADILLLDEPTNHLDTTNVEWLVNYLNKASITALIVSHDSSFLDNVCTDILHYEGRKLKRYRGNISEFVKIKPEAQSYYKLDAATLRFTFPDPPPLDGVTSRQKSILNMKKVWFQYPGSDKKALQDVTCHVRLDSRVAVLGRNGAGKSTLVKVLTSELRPEGGGVMRHPNLRVAYVAQHAFHHLEQCLDISPARYILRRYSGGEDKEEAQKVHRQMSPEEWDRIKKQIWMIDGQPRILDKIVGRRKKKRSYEYEVAWVGLTSLSYNRWITREELCERGFEKLINDVDGKSAAQQKVGEQSRPLTMAAIEEFCRDFGLDPEFSMHSNIRGLSGGQKVKLVLAAAMWQNPHMLIMDEPTNYLDREALGALADAIKRWQGGVVVISHHQEFIGAVCSEVWHVEDGKLHSLPMAEYKKTKITADLEKEDQQLQQQQQQPPQ